MALHTVRRASFTRPANTTLYTAGDAMGAGAAGCVLQFPPVSPKEERGGKITGGRPWKSSTGTRVDKFRLLVYQATPTANPDENAAPTTAFVNIADVGKFIGQMDFEAIDYTLAAGLTYLAQDLLPSGGLPFFPQDQGNRIFGILTAIGGYDPASAEEFNITLNIEQ